ncbi:competence protein ComEC [Enterococcus sp. AZ135]|uniref:DNA internalization-related competence protein ComEC/Rec2 n=1 Tax=unclassified Enterococcus TaxID=2608891 RepID=UPI003F253884
MTGKIKGKKYLIYHSLKSPEEKRIWGKKNLPNSAVINGEIEKFDSARNLNGFDAKKYYFSLGFSRIIQVKNLKPFKSKRFILSNVRHHLIWTIDQHYSKRLASYIKALVIGYKDAEFGEYSAIYKTTGLLHLFTLSGLHIQFYLGSIHLLLKRGGLARESRLVLLCLIGFLLIFLTGSGFSTIRAVLSFLIGFACLTFDVLLSKLDQWSLMLFLLVFCFPLVFWSVGAQLSLYFALLLLYLNDLRSNVWHQMFLFSILSLPILIYSFSEWNLTGGLFTILLFPIFEWLILPSCLLLFVGCFLPIPQIFGNLTEVLFLFLEKMLVFVDIPPLTTGRPIFSIFLLLLLLVLIIIDRLKYRQNRFFLLGIAVFLLFSISFSANGIVAFVDVGQGDSIFIKLPFKQETFLIDTGGRLIFKQKQWQNRQPKQISDYNLLPFLKSLGCSEIDHLFVTHNDADHMGELSHVLNEVKVKNLYLARGSQIELQNLLKQTKNTNIHLIKRGDTIGRKLKIQILSPEKSEGENNDSLVAYFQLNQQRFLLTGDLETIGEENLLKNYPQLKTDFLKIGHHGSNTSTSEEFLEKIKPKYGIISVGQKNRYGHPTEETLQKLNTHKVKVLRTDQQGMIYYQWSAITKRGRIKTLIDFLN